VRRRDGTHHDHSLETETDVRVRRLFATAGDRCVTLGWDYPGKTLLEARILRSTERPAQGPDDVGTGVDGSASAETGDATHPVLVYHDVTGSFRDEGLENGRVYVYSVFARHPGGEWVRWDDLELTPRAGEAADSGGGAKPGAAKVGRPGGGAGRMRPAAAAASALALFAALFAVALALAAGFALTALADDGDQTDGQGDAKAAAGEARAAAWDVAVAYPLVASLLDGREPSTSDIDVALWPPDSDPAGATVYLLWPGGVPAEIDDELPVVRRSDPDEPPVAPYEVVTHRVRAVGVTGLRVLVDLADGSVLEVYPWDEHADFVLHEDTTAPFSWAPWFTSHAWVLLPVFGGLALYLGIRSYLRSRAWRRRLPSMSRHDRQFLGRILAALLMTGAVALMVAAVWRAVAVPILDPDRMVGGDLSTWPLVVFPPLLYVAAIGLELSGGPHRVAWSLVAVIAGASCVYVLVAMQEAAVTNVTLLYYVLLGCLTLVAIPRAFAPGKLGWSRSSGRAGSSF
jgi:hypothetical protein